MIRRAERRMLLLLPYIIIGLGLTLGLCSAAGYTGALLVVMLIVWFLAGTLGSILLLVLILLLISFFVDIEKPQRAPAPFFAAVVTYVMGAIVKLLRIRIHEIDEAALPEGRWLLVGNHRSAFDPIITGWALRRCGLVFISKPENLHIPLVGKFLHKAGFLSIDRENDRAALRTILAAADMIRSGAASVAVYPEGTRSREEGMLPFRNGVFKIAQKARAPVVVVAVRGADQVAKHAPWRPTDVYLDVCGVLDAETVSQHKTVEIGGIVQECISSANI